MRLNPRVLLAAAAVAAATPAAAAPNPTTVSDVRCLMTMVVLRQNPQNATAAQAGIYFFGARISALDPKADVAAIMKTETNAMNTQAAVQAEAQRCGPMINAAMQPIQTALTAVLKARPASAAAPGAPAPAAPAAAPPAAAPAPKP